MMNKETMVALGVMGLGGLLVLVGLLQVPVISGVLIIVGALMGFIGYTLYKDRNNNEPPEGMIFG